MEGTVPAVSVTVVRETSGASQRLLQYAGNPLDDELQTLMEHVARLVSVDRETTTVEVILGGTPDQPQSCRRREALRQQLGAARHRIDWATP